MIDSSLPSILISHRPSLLSPSFLQKNIFRPAIESIKMVAATFEGISKGPMHAYEAISVGSSIAIGSALTAWTLNAGKDNSFFNHFNPVFNFLPSFVKSFIDAPPSTWFFAALIKGSLLHEAYNHPFRAASNIETLSLAQIELAITEIDKQIQAIDFPVKHEALTSTQEESFELEESEEEFDEILENEEIEISSACSEDLTKTTALQLSRKDLETLKSALLKAKEERSHSADVIEKFALSKELVTSLESEEYTTTALKISKWTTGLGVMMALGIILHHALDTAHYTSQDLPEYIQDHLVAPVLSLASALKLS